MSLRVIFNKLFFKKHKPGKVVAQSGDKVFQKLTAEPLTPPPLTGIDPSNFSLGLIPLPPGTYTIVATVHAPRLGLAESDFSNSVEYTVE